MMDKNEIIINSLSFKQAAKWILIHERRRHLVDIAGCDIDLENLKDIEIPAEAMELIDYHFEIPSLKTQENDDYKATNLDKGKLCIPDCMD